MSRCMLGAVSLCVAVYFVTAAAGDWFYPEEEGTQCSSPPLTVTAIGANGSVAVTFSNGTATRLHVGDSCASPDDSSWSLVGTVTSAQRGGAATSLGVDSYAVFECQQPSWGALVAVDARGVLSSARKAVGALAGLAKVPRYSYGPEYYDQIYTSASDVLQQRIINRSGGLDTSYAQAVKLLPPMPDVVSLGSSSPNVSRYVVGPDAKVTDAGYAPAWAKGASGFDPMPYVIQDGVLTPAAGGDDKCTALRIVGCSSNFTVHANSYFENAPLCCGGATSRSIPIKANTSNADALAACESACLQMSECTSAQINPSYPAPPGTCTLRKCQGPGSNMSGVTTAIRDACRVAPPPPPTGPAGNPQHLFDAIKPGMLGGEMRAVNMGYWSTELFAGFELSALSTSLGGCQTVPGASLPEVCGRCVVRLVTQAPPSLTSAGKRVTRYFELLAGVANESVDGGALFYDAVFGLRRTVDARLKAARVALEVPHADRRVVDQARSALQQGLDVYVGMMPNYGTGVYWSPDPQRGGGTADVTWPVVVALLDYGEVARAAQLVTYYLQSGIYASPGWKPNDQYPGSGPTDEHPEWLPDTFAAYGKALHVAALVSRRLDGELQDQRGQGGAAWLQANHPVLERIASLLLRILAQQQGRLNPPHNRTTPNPHHGGFKELWQGQCCDKKQSPSDCNSSAIPCGASVPASHYHDGLLTGPGDHDSCDSFQFAFFSINAVSPSSIYLLKLCLLAKERHCRLT